METRLHRVFALLGAVLLGLFFVALYKEWDRDWTGPQRDYLRVLKRQSFSQGIESSTSLPAIQQLDLADLGRIDRCTTCHLGVEDPLFQEVPEPLATHSGLYLKWHPLEEFGCTACHGGQGMATSFRGAAHEEIPHWDEPILPLPYTEANCGTCHTGRDIPGAPILSEGRRLIARANCTGCHEIPGYKEGEVWGTPYGSELNDAGVKVNRNWLVQWLQDPKGYLDRPRMPTFRFSEDEIRSLVAFLMNQRRREVEPIPAGRAGQGDPVRGKTVFGEARCVSCHTVRGKGGPLAPDLERIMNKVSPDWLYSFIKNPHYYASHTKMLQYNFSEQEVLDLVAYMKDDFYDPEFPRAPEALLAPSSPEEEAALLPVGEKLFLESGCLGCHAIEGLKNPGRIGPSLAFVGSRTAGTLEFGPVQDIKRNLSNWLFGKLKDPTRYDQKAKMPDYHFTDEEAAKLTVALMSLKEVTYAERKKVPVEIGPEGIFNPLGGPFNPQGKFGQLFTKFRCFSCHQVYGIGGTLSHAPLDREGSQVKPHWLVSYLMKPDMIRPSVIERMPSFRMTREEAELMAGYISSVFVDDAIPLVGEEDLREGEQAHGRYLFDKFGCIGCHIEGPKGGGYVGPDLTGVGNRLQPGWIIEWLMHPQRYRRDTIHPDYQLSEAEARSLAAYLTTFKGEGGGGS